MSQGVLVTYLDVKSVHMFWFFATFSPSSVSFFIFPPEVDGNSK